MSTPYSVPMYAQIEQPHRYRLSLLSHQTTIGRFAGLCWPTAVAQQHASWNRNTLVSLVRVLSTVSSVRSIRLEIRDGRSQMTQAIIDWQKCADPTVTVWATVSPFVATAN